MEDRGYTHESNPATPNFIVDLTRPFDENSFDSNFRRIAYHTEDGYDGKYIVVGDNLLVISATGSHKHALDEILRDSPDLKDVIESAGMVYIKTQKSGFGSEITKNRVIYGMSTGLSDSRELTYEKSERYKQTELKDILGEYFEIQE